MQPSSPPGLLALVQIYYSIDLFTPSLAYCVRKEIHYSRGQTLFHYTSRLNALAFIKNLDAPNALRSCHVLARSIYQLDLTPFLHSDIEIH